MAMIIGRFLKPLDSSRTTGSVRAGVTTTRAGKCRIQQAFGTLMPEVQKELHRIAARYLAVERPGHELQATALINAPTP